jgi:hypothetical protein
VGCASSPKSFLSFSVVLFADTMPTCDVNQNDGNPRMITASLGMAEEVALFPPGHVFPPDFVIENYRLSKLLGRLSVGIG